MNTTNAITECIEKLQAEKERLEASAEALNLEMDAVTTALAALSSSIVVHRPIGSRGGTLKLGKGPSPVKPGRGKAGTGLFAKVVITHFGKTPDEPLSVPAAKHMLAKMGGSTSGTVTVFKHHVRAGRAVETTHKGSNAILLTPEGRSFFGLG